MDVVRLLSSDTILKILTFRTLPPNLSVINFNIILASTPRSYKKSVPFTFYNQIHIHFNLMMLEMFHEGYKI